VMAMTGLAERGAEADGYVAQAKSLMGQEKYAEAIEQVELALGVHQTGEEAQRLKKEIEAKLSLTLNLGNGVTMRLVRIAPGNFMMGSPPTEESRSGDEAQHAVTISRPLYMGVTEVTQEQYEAVMGGNPSYFKGAKNPVEQVSWNEATEFCQKLSQRTGKSFRLPTEAEWEYACRAGTTTPFHTGSTLSTDQANYDGNHTYGPGGEKGVYRQETTPAATFKPNAWGLYDMHGNVSEWCYDAYKADLSNKSRGPRVEGDVSTARVLRGGSWDGNPQRCRSALRIGFVPDYRYLTLGFRVAMDSP
jgi:formylglycine-generating enzyme required for sulfatase activity